MTKKVIENYDKLEIKYRNDTNDIGREFSRSYLFKNKEEKMDQKYTLTFQASLPPPATPLVF